MAKRLTNEQREAISKAFELLDDVHDKLVELKELRESGKADMGGCELEDLPKWVQKRLEQASDKLNPLLDYHFFN